MEKIYELGKEDILFSGIDSVCEDAPQNIYVLDRLASKIYKFIYKKLVFGLAGRVSIVVSIYPFNHREEV